MNRGKRNENNKTNTQTNGLHAQQAALEASAEMKREQAWSRLEGLITELHTSLNHGQMSTRKLSPKCLQKA